MATISPLAAHFNTPQQLELMRNFVGDRDLPQIELDVERIERVVLKEFWQKLNKGQLKDLEKVVAKEIFEQIHKGLKEIFK